MDPTPFLNMWVVSESTHGAVASEEDTDFGWLTHTNWAGAPRKVNAIDLTDQLNDDLLQFGDQT